MLEYKSIETYGGKILKALICCLNSKYIHASLAPWCLSAGVSEYCLTPWNTKVLESTINNEIESLISKIIEEKPQVVSFCAYIWNITKTLEICKEIKEKTETIVVLGGPEVAYRAKETLQDYPFIDYVLSGEGEESFPELLDAIANKNIQIVDGLTYRKKQEIISNPVKEYTGTPVSPYTTEFYKNLKGRICYIETSRGCPYRCDFCLSGRCSSLRFFDMQRVKEDILNLSNSGTQTVKFVDRTFNAKSKRANEILKFILSNYGDKIPGNVCFHFEIAGDILTEETLNILSSAPKGAIQLEIGMQSFNEETLKTINRKTNTKKLIENIKKLISFQNMHIHIDLIAGLTGEDIKSFEKSFNIGYSLSAHMLQMGFLKLLYGTEMRENTEKYPCEFSKNPPYEVTKTPWLSELEILQLKKCEDALKRLYNSGRFLYTLGYLINSCGYTPFELFMEFGNAVDGSNMTLSNYTETVYNYFSEFVDKDVLREKTLCDLLSSSYSAPIPKSLLIKDKHFKKIKKHFVQKMEGRTKIAILYKSNLVYVVNENNEKDLHGRHKGEFFELTQFNNCN